MLKIIKRLLAGTLITLLIIPALMPLSASANSALNKFSQLKNAGLLMMDSQGQPLISDNPDTPYIPASTTKLVTAWLALKHWKSVNHRFKTHFFWDEASKTLTVKGSGDPFLISEELDIVARNLRQKGLREINTIILDTSLFQSNLVMPGTGKTNNPYDAVPSALAVNFNTVFIKKVNGKVISAEPQTPLTKYARSMSSRFKKGKLRVNTGRNPRDAEAYFAEVLTAFLQKQGIQVTPRVKAGLAPRQAPFYTHVNSKNLGDMIKPMMKYSTNFIANQLVLSMSAEHYGRPANAADVQRYMQETLSRHFGWVHFTMKEGAGLSRANRLSPRQLVNLLEAFKPWKYLLPEIESGVFAKSGTLNKVSTLAGYIEENGQLKPFALMMNQGVPYKLRNRIARALASR